MTSVELKFAFSGDGSLKEARTYMDAEEWKLAMWKLREWLMAERKYEENECRRQALTDAIEYMFEILDDMGLDVDDV